MRVLLLVITLLSVGSNICLPAQRPLPFPALPRSTQTLPPDVSFCIVDGKFKNGTLKICEMGQGVVSGFLGHQRLFGIGSIWENAWKFFAKLPINTICHTHPKTHPARKDHFAFYEIERLKIPIYTTLQNIQQPALLVATEPFALFKHYDIITQRYPNLMILDDATKPFVLNKILTHLFFADDPELEKLRPQCKIVPRIYSPTLAREITDTMPAQRYVIKPMNAIKGKGIIFVEKKHLDNALNLILTKPQHARFKKRLQQEPFKFWTEYTKPFFLVESYEASAPIISNNKPYDPTMRIAFGLSHFNGTVNIEFFGAYWKLPSKALDETGSLEEKFKSRIKPGTVCSARVDLQTYEQIKQILSASMPTVYLKMIAARYNYEFLNTTRRQLGLGPYADDFSTNDA